PDLRRAITYFPLCGALVGGFAALGWWLATLVFPAALAAGLALVAGVVLTGALHEDGWADVCDGFGGGHTRERILEIMKDSRIGAYGVLGLVLLLGLKWQALASLPSALVPAALVAGHALSRGMAATLMATLDYARAEGPSKSRALVVRLGGGRLVIVVATALVPLVLLPVAAWWGAVALVILRVALARWYRQRLGGYTGDCLGAAQQLGELVFYLVLLGVAR
ncbi:MAG TPA: adenosylcobinamide-GDP ribazoletransferase, partial [Opitutaceae bacterium]|nr:adenosylcobinamide-GDP ribazoletransferase [Opitutaceae bacterium]